MRPLPVILLAMAALLLSCLPAEARTDDPWTPRETCIFGMPYLGRAVGKQDKGLITGVLKEAFEGANMEFRHAAVPYKRALDSMREGSVHCTLDVKNGQKDFLHSEAILAFYDLSVAYLRKDGYTGFESLTGNRVAFLHGFDLKRFVPVQIKTQLVYDLSSAFHMLERGHVAYILGDEMLLKDAMYASNLPTRDFVISPITSYDMRLIFAPTDKGRRFLKKFDRRFKEMMKNGDLAEILIENGLSKQGVQRIIKAND